MENQISEILLKEREREIAVPSSGRGLEASKCWNPLTFTSAFEFRIIMRTTNSHEGAVYKTGTCFRRFHSLRHRFPMNVRTFLSHHTTIHNFKL